MSTEGFEATFVLAVDRDLVWKRLTEHPVTDGHYWLPGFDSAATVVEEESCTRLRLTKDEQPCAGRPRPQPGTLHRAARRASSTAGRARRGIPA